MDDPASNKSPRLVTVLVGVFFLLVVAYLLPLAVVFLDEAVFRTYFISRTLPVSAGDTFKMLYFFHR